MYYYHVKEEIRGKMMMSRTREKTTNLQTNLHNQSIAMTFSVRTDNARVTMKATREHFEEKKTASTEKTAKQCKEEQRGRA
jgi:hypothetical protein